MKRVFADTHFYIALLNRKDSSHEKAKDWIGDAELDTIVTTGWFVAETANATAKSHRRSEFCSNCTELSVRKSCLSQMNCSGAALIFTWSAATGNGR